MPPSNATAWVEALPWAEACLIGVAFLCGAALGSFLNVVAHRVPRGDSPVLGGSRCPACGRAILARDNVPILGWLLLRGRCRGCQAAISPRYVFVELACGGLTAALAAARLACDRHDLDRLLVQGDLRPLLAFTGQVAVLMTLVAWSLLAERGHRVTPVTRRLTMASALGWYVVVAMLHAGPAETNAAASWPWLRPMLTSLAGGGLGWLAGSLCQALGLTAGTSSADRDMLTVVGLALGWPPVLPVAAATAALGMLGRGGPIARFGVPPATLVAMTACGRWLDALAGCVDWLR